MRRLLLLALLLPGAARADRGALSLDGGVILSAARVPPAIGTADSTFGTIGGATIGARYAVSNNLECGLAGSWYRQAKFSHDNTTVSPSGTGSFTGQLQSEVGRYGVGVNLQYVGGLTLRWHLGGEIGWSRVSYSNIDLVNVATDPPSSFGNVGATSKTMDGIVVAPMAGLEYLVTDHLSFAITPRIEFLLGEPAMTAFTIPITVSYSWYGLFGR
jgi:hypothetical protein